MNAIDPYRIKKEESFMRKALSALLALVMCFAIITACMAESTASTAEYTGTGTGFGGEIVVKLSLIHI